MERTFVQRLQNALRPTPHQRVAAFDERLGADDSLRHLEEGRVVTVFGRKLSAKRLAALRVKALAK